MLNKFIQTIMITLFFLGGTTMSNADDSNINSITTVLPVERIEPSIPFWEAAGFVRGESVPEGDHLGFLMMQVGDKVIMLQTLESMKADNEVFSHVTSDNQGFLFIQVKDVKAAEKALAGFDQIMAYRETFYGSKEVGYKTPGGHIITFAQFSTEE